MGSLLTGAIIGILVWAAVFGLVILGRIIANPHAQDGGDG